MYNSVLTLHFLIGTDVLDSQIALDCKISAALGSSPSLCQPLCLLRAFLSPAQMKVSFSSTLHLVSDCRQGQDTNPDSSHSFPATLICKGLELCYAMHPKRMVQHKHNAI